MTSNTTLEELLAAGAHFGHRTSKWHPKMAPYIYTVRGGVHIIDLEKTKIALDAVLATVRAYAAQGKTILFVGVKKQTTEVVRAAAIKAGEPYVVGRWLGGTITNFGVIQKMIKRLDKLEEQAVTGALKKYTKKEQMLLHEESKRLLELIGGIRHLKKIPDVLFIIGARESKTAIREAQRKNIPIVAVCDTNDNPDEITHVIPANDDAVKSVRLMADIVAEAVLEGKAASAAPAVAPAPTVIHPEEEDVEALRLRQELTRDLEKLDEQTDQEQHESKLKLNK